MKPEVEIVRIPVSAVRAPELIQALNKAEREILPRPPVRTSGC